jgi:hypothetical protein
MGIPPGCWPIMFIIGIIIDPDVVAAGGCDGAAASGW